MFAATLAVSLLKRAKASKPRRKRLGSALDTFIETVLLDKNAIATNLQLWLRCDTIVMRS